jgi:hypothetical protein
MYWGINLRLVLYSLAATFLFSAGWTINGWRHEAGVTKSLQKTQIVNNQLQNALAEERQKKDAEIRRINNLYRDSLKQLRDRPLRGAQLTQNGKTCTGADLSREDADFLVGEAARADEVVVSLNYCYKVYEETRKKLESLH